MSLNIMFGKQKNDEAESEELPKEACRYTRDRREDMLILFAYNLTVLQSCCETVFFRNYFLLETARYIHLYGSSVEVLLCYRRKHISHALFMRHSK